MGVEGSFIPAAVVAEYPAFSQQECAADRIDASAIEELSVSADQTGRWPPKVRDLYREEIEARVYREHHFLFMLGFITCLATIGIDALINPAMAKEGAILRVLLVGPVTLLAMFAASKRWTQVVLACVIVAPVTFAGIITYLTFQLPPHYAATYLTATTLIIGLANIVLPLSMRGLLVFDFAFIGTVLTVLALGPDGELIYHAHYLLLLSVVASGTLPLAARIEQLRRRNFLLNLHTQFSASELRDANRKLRDLSERDPLTGALNRRGLARIFDARLASASAQAGTDGVCAAMIMVDIDHFKHFNDTHGHLAGDTCLTMVAQALQSVIGEEGWLVARYGGEEFIVALCESYSGQASDLAEDIRKRIAALLVPVGGEHGPSGRSLVTASLGVGLGARMIVPVAHGDCEFIREELIEMADAALYSAKNSGRNRVELVGRADPIARSA